VRNRELKVLSLVFNIKILRLWCEN
jgi:hypothetical protein